MKKTARDLIFTNDHTDTEGTWAISYGDMITLLLSFFVIYFSTDFTEKKEKELNTGLMENLESGKYDKMLDHMVEEQTTTPENLTRYQSVVEETDDGRLMIYFPKASFFKSGRTTVIEDKKALLDQLAKSYLPYAGKYKLKIQAFTDGRKVIRRIANKYEDNLELSVFRALSVMRYLEKSGIPAHRMELGGRGVFRKEIFKSITDKELTQKEMEAYSRTVAFVLVREDA